MTVASGMLSVNAAFLREIKEDNQRVHELFDEAAGLLAAAHAHDVTARQVVECLNDLRDQLSLHFSLEEAYGYFEDAIDVAPQLSTQAAELRSEHGALFLTCCGLVDEAEQWLYRETPREMLSRIDREFHEFRRRFREHESRETSLILDAFDNDVGVGD